jgi:hypothetical protein
MHIILPFYSRFISWAFPPRCSFPPKGNMHSLSQTFQSNDQTIESVPFHRSNGHSCCHYLHTFPPVLTVNPQYVSPKIHTVAGFKARRHYYWGISNSLTYNMADGRLSIETTTFVRSMIIVTNRNCLKIFSILVSSILYLHYQYYLKCRKNYHNADR